MFRPRLSFPLQIAVSCNFLTIDPEPGRADPTPAAQNRKLTNQQLARAESRRGNFKPP